MRLLVTARRAGLAALAGLVLAAPAHAAESPVWLDSYSRSNDGYLGPVRTVDRLRTGKPYVATVRGTFSYYAMWNYKQFCGVRERRPIFPSPGVRNGRVGADAAFIFADRKALCDQRGGQAVVPLANFQLTSGGRYAKAVPLRKPTVPSPRHKYRYALLGKGKQARFRLKDVDTFDNYGRLRITLAPASARYCTAAEGFKSFGFATAEECVAATSLRG